MANFSEERAQTCSLGAELEFVLDFFLCKMVLPQLGVYQAK